MSACCLGVARLLHILALVCSIQAAVNYAGHKVVRMVPKTKTHLDMLRVLRSTDNELDFWTEPSSLDANVDVRVSPADLEELTNKLEQHSIDHAIFIEDVQKAIDRQQNEVDSNEVEYREGNRPVIDFTKYHRLDVIHQYLESLALAYPDIVQVMSIGQSSEGRNLQVIKIGNKARKCNPAIWVDAGIHAREWIASAVAMYLIDQLTNNYDANRQLVDNVDWYILPSMNPDGYEFTHTDDRLWRKTRSSTRKLLCKGVDANRNFAFHFKEGGSSGYPCSDIYRGPKAMSEPETQAVGNFLVEHKDQLKVYVSLHSYGQVILTPWAYTYKLPEDFDELYSLAGNASQALTAVNGTTYTIGSVTHLLYVASGSSADYAKGVAGIPYSYVIELRDGGDHGFLLPAEQISVTGQETWEVFKYFGEAIGDLSNQC